MTSPHWPVMWYAPNFRETQKIYWRLFVRWTYSGCSKYFSNWRQCTTLKTCLFTKKQWRFCFQVQCWNILQQPLLSFIFTSKSKPISTRSIFSTNFSFNKTKNAHYFVKFWKNKVNFAVPIYCTAAI